MQVDLTQEEVATPSGLSIPPTGPPSPPTTAERPTLMEYFASIRHLPGDLQEILLRAFLSS